MSGDDIHFLLHLRNQIKLYHWQTRTYARHIATDKLLEDVDSIIDKYVEVYIGKYGRRKLTAKQAQIQLANLTEAGASRFVTAAIRYAQGPLIKHLNLVMDTDLINLKDELVATLNQLLYLFTLRGG